VESLLEKHETVLDLLRQRRRGFVEQCANRLARNYIFHEYRQEAFRHKFEVRRIWDKVTNELVHAAIEMAERDQSLMLFPLQVVLQEASCLSALPVEYGVDKEILNRVVNDITHFIGTVRERQLEAERILQEGRIERVVRFLRQIQDLEAAAEQHFRQANRKENPLAGWSRCFHSLG
jgi:hypothetical protein